MTAKLFRICGTCGALVEISMLGPHMTTAHRWEAFETKSPLTLYFGTEVFAIPYLQGEEYAAVKKEGLV